MDQEDNTENINENVEPAEIEEHVDEEENNDTKSERDDLLDDDDIIDKDSQKKVIAEDQLFSDNPPEDTEPEQFQVTVDELQKEMALGEVEEDAEDSSQEGEAQEQSHETEKDDDETKSVSEGRRGSILYDMGPRIRDLEDNPILGDFLQGEEDVPFKFYKYIDEKDEEEGEEEEEVEEEEISIDRTPYIELYQKLSKEISEERLKNNILQKKLAKVFKRRKMDHVLKETDQQFDTQEKYGRKLDAYGELAEYDYIQRTTITNELDSLKSDKESKLNEINKLFEDLQNQEKDTGYGLIHTKTGKPIPDKLVERLIHRQKHQMQTVGDMRLKYIQLKNMVVEKQNAISKLDKIGENLYLMDYEQLKVENRSYMDKMEEKDEELARLRNKCQKTIQILAHMREKSAALESDIYDLSDELVGLNHNGTAVRANLNKLKQQRDYYRNMTNKLRDESGLLTETELLRDMEFSIEELKTLKEELEVLKAEHKVKAQQIRNIRKNIEFPPEGLIKRTQKDVFDKTSHGRHLYKGRPSLHKPTLPEDAFKHLKNFKGKPTFDKNKKFRRIGNK